VIGKWHMPGPLPKLAGVDPFITFTINAGQGRYFDCPLVATASIAPAAGTWTMTHRLRARVPGAEATGPSVSISHSSRPITTGRRCRSSRTPTTT
jgi:hypothetical protein